MRTGLIVMALLSLSLPAHAQRLMATAEIKGCTDPGIYGKAKIVEKTSAEGIKEVTVKMMVEGLSDGKHAVHIHEVGACEPCGAAKGHHDPGPFGQSRPDSAGDDVPAADINHPYHMGDLINIEVNKGKGEMTHTTNRITLSPGRLSILDEDGSAFIIHTNPDTYCDEEADLKKGCAGGSRDACGIIRSTEKYSYEPVEVTLDVYPGIEKECNGAIPIAVLGSDTLDVAQIDPLTLSFEGLDVRETGRGFLSCNMEDVNYDGYSDLVCQFLNGEHDGTLSGVLADGMPIEGIATHCIAH